MLRSYLVEGIDIFVALALAKVSSAQSSNEDGKTCIVFYDFDGIGCKPDMTTLQRNFPNWSRCFSPQLRKAAKSTSDHLLCVPSIYRLVGMITWAFHLPDCC